MEIRNFNEKTDFPAFMALLAIATSPDGSIALSSDEMMTERDHRDQADLYTLDLNADRFVMQDPTDPQSFIAVCDVWKMQDNPSAELMLLVHPQWRKQGIGGKMLSKGIKHARAINANAIDAYADSEQEDVCSFLELHNFDVAGLFRNMDISEEDYLPTARPNPNWEVLNYNELKGNESDKLELLLSANSFWGDLWGHKVQLGSDKAAAKADLKQFVLEAFLPENMLFLFEEGDLVAHVKSGIRADADTNEHGYIDMPGVRKDKRKTEIYRELVLMSADLLYQQGCSEISIESWGESDETIAIFEELGFVVTFYELGYQLKLA